MMGIKCIFLWFRIFYLTHELITLPFIVGISPPILSPISCQIHLILKIPERTALILGGFTENFKEDQELLLS